MKTRTTEQWARESIRRAEKRSERKVYAERMLIKFRCDKNMSNIKHWYEAGESMKIIAKRLGTTPNNIHRRLRRMGVTIRRAVRYQKVVNCKVCGKTAKGYTELCALHWRLRAAKRSKDWWTKNRKKGACCPVEYK